MRPVAQQSDALTQVTAESDVGAKPPFGEGTIDQKPGRPEVADALELSAIESLVRGSIIRLVEGPRAVVEGRETPGRSPIGVSENPAGTGVG